MDKTDMDLEISFRTGLPQNTVKKITACFVDLMREALVQEGYLHIIRFGTLHVRWWRGPALIDGTRRMVHKANIAFKRGTILKQQLKASFTMEKYAVDESLAIQEDEKQAAAATKCPKCGAPIELHGRVRKCPNCGTAPFEGE